MLTRSVEEEENNNNNDNEDDNDNEKHTGVLFVPAGLYANASVSSNDTYKPSRKTNNASAHEKLFKWQQSADLSRSKRDL